MKTIYKIALSLLVVLETCVFINKQLLINAESISNNYKYSINDNFASDSLLITLTEEESNKHNSYCIEDFSIEKLVDVRELSSECIEQVRNVRHNCKRTFKLTFIDSSKQDILDYIRVLNDRSEIYAAEPNFIGEYLLTTPNDDYIDFQWGIENANLFDAWDFVTGSNSVNVGVLDSGIDNTHLDLLANINTTLSADFTGNNNPWYISGHHATHVAGIIGACGNNERGVTGVNWNVSLVSLKVGDFTPITSSVIAAITYAQENNIPILNMSFGIDNSIALSNAIESYDGLIICASGNASFDVDANPVFPACYDFDNIISVGSINDSNNISNFSNWGLNSVDIFAPGGQDNLIDTDDIASTYPDSLIGNLDTGYHYLSGTSMSAPFVTGVAALLLAININLTPVQLKTAILNSANTPTINNENPLLNLCVTSGKLDALGAVQYVLENYMTTNSVVTLDCNSQYKYSTQDCDAGNAIFYKFNINCAKSYTFESNAAYPINMTLYNSNFNPITAITPTMSNNNCTGTITEYFNPDTYYLKINYASDSDNGNITTSYKATWPSNGIEVYANTSNNMKTHLHATINNKFHSLAYFINSNGSGYYKFRLNAGSNVTYPVGAIRIYTDSNRQNLLSRYSVSGIYSNAFSNYNENEMYVYLPENGTYYIDIVMPNNNYNILTLYIERSDINNFDYTNTLAFQSFTPLFENQSTQNYFEEVTISHRSKFSLEVLTSGIVTSSMPVYIFQKVLEPGNEPGVYNYYPVRVSNPNWYITAYNSNPIYNIVLEAGTYYFGYDLNSNNVDISFCLRRVVDYDASSLATLITDPALNQGYTLGSEVNFNGGLPLDTTITEGFTRCIYLMFGNYIALPDSRLDYDWYSSNDNLASVTRYGTVLARPVNVDTNVTIYAVLKEDPSVVLSIQLTILNDVETEEIEIVSNLSYSYSLENGTYQLELDNTNSPFPWISYYLWAITESSEYPNLEVEMNTWGYITSNGIGEAVLTGEYNLNSRVYLTIYLTIFV